MRLAEFFEETGKLSNARLNSSLALYLAFAMVIVGLAGGPAVDYSIFLTLIGYGAGTKIIQKPMEKKNAK